MKFKIGDKVKFLNDTSNGIVTGFMNEKIVLVKIEEGFEVPVLKDEIIPTGDSIDYSESFSMHDDENSVESNDSEIPVYPNDIKEDTPDKNEMEEMYLSKEIKNKDIPVFGKPKPEKKSSDISEIDLHITEILENHSGMSNGEILKVQLDRFTTALEGVLKTDQRKIVFIHGLGNGKLKFEVRKLLDTKYNHLKYQDASFKEYGYGATMIILR
ncbi:MAG: Smr/MutS family protein [Bacteroidales bacterium]|nr:Smr/MutS family protein [Bacteroidales bacterium]